MVAGWAPSPLTCACRKSNPDVLVVQPAKNWTTKNLPGSISCTTAVGDGGGTLAEHHDVVEAFSSHRTDQPFGISVLPWGTRRRRLIANAH
jgi:hypothetical protein